MNYHLREGIITARKHAIECKDGAGGTHGRGWLKRSIDFLERYFCLLLFTSYLLEEVDSDWFVACMEILLSTHLCSGTLAATL